MGPMNTTLPDATFTADDYLKLFNYNYDTGFPSGHKYTLLDLAHMNYFFEKGRKHDFDDISDYFDLGSSDKAEVLWYYV
jgi:hypothetical protein